ncbi:protein adenylyltransferase SelO [Moheibacter lacus]|uniref:Protein nucleotidyltransferase YdiU n=1 Tax=Moheibacter lacus TaxID=2745851 RepID=A0A838ZS87_9FLAO|nr:YdiU family protein [Moheibacter lacus]MBA5629843.1 YdiU family protein [Moheibacter lacus]
MKSDSIFNFDNSYKKLSPKFFESVHPFPAPNPELLLLNQDLLKELDLENADKNELAQILSGNKLAVGSEPIAQAYAGHQFGHFTMLGDGRAILLGEHLTNSEKRLDIQLKGSGQTPFSRRGDGKATLKSMLREYLMSEAIHHLGIPTSRSLAVIKTGEKVYREMLQDGAVLTRIMRSHIRVGTFEFARYFGGIEYVDELMKYTTHRHFPELKEAKNQALALLEKVMELQMDLIINWTRVGFIHGVMNTDNASISDETFDYGPCAFLGKYIPETVFSSIDTHGRYAFGNQPNIIKWNLARFAETLIPLIDSDEKKAIEMATEKINEFDQKFTQKWYRMYASKLGFVEIKEGDEKLVDEFLGLMEIHQKDYTNSFTFLRMPEIFDENQFFLDEKFEAWISKWKLRIQNQEGGKQAAFDLMQKTNPVFIPRNYFVEKALETAVNGDLTEFNSFLEILKNPYEFNLENKNYLHAPEAFDAEFVTFCGT